MTILLKLLQALDGQHQIFLGVFQIFHTLVSQSQVIVEFCKFFALKLINIIFVVQGRCLSYLSVLVLRLCLLLLLNELPFPDFEHSLKQLAGPFIFLLLSEVDSNSLDDTGIFLFDTHVEAAEDLLLLLK